MQLMARRMVRSAQTLFASATRWLDSVNQRLADPLPAESPSGDAPISDTVPAHWQEKLHGNGPPQHWLEDIRKRTIDPDKTVTFSATIEPPDGRGTGNRIEIRDRRLGTENDDAVSDVPKVAVKTKLTDVAGHRTIARSRARAPFDSVRHVRPKDEETVGVHPDVKAQPPVEGSAAIHRNAKVSPEVEAKATPNRSAKASQQVELTSRVNGPERAQPQVDTPADARRTQRIPSEVESTNVIHYPVVARQQVRATTATLRHANAHPKVDAPAAARYHLRTRPVAKTRSTNWNVTRAQPYGAEADTRFSAELPAPGITSTPKVQSPRAAPNLTTEPVVNTTSNPNAGISNKAERSRVAQPAIDPFSTRSVQSPRESSNLYFAPNHWPELPPTDWLDGAPADSTADREHLHRLAREQEGVR